MNEAIDFIRDYHFIDFIRNHHFMVIYGITLILSIVSYRKYFDTTLKYFPIILAYTFFNELLGVLIRDSQQFQIIFIDQYRYHNIIIYNIYYVVFFLYFTYVYVNSLNNRKHQKIIKIGGLVYFASCVANALVQDFIIYPQLYAFLCGSILLIVCLSLYFIKLRRENHFQYLPNKFNLLFWVSLGLIVFYGFYTPVKALRSIDYHTYLTYFRTPHLLMIAIMHIFFCIGFVKSKRRAFR